MLLPLLDEAYAEETTMDESEETRSKSKAMFSGENKKKKNTGISPFLLLLLFILSQTRISHVHYVAQLQAQKVLSNIFWAQIDILSHLR